MSSHARGTLRGTDPVGDVSAPMVRTRHPGIFKRGSRYVVTYRHGGKLRKETTRTLDEARQLKAERTRQVHSGEFSAQSRVTFQEYAFQWVDRYNGRGGRNGFREGTREDYRSALNRWVFERVEKGQVIGYFGERVKVAEVSPRHISEFVSWLARQKGSRGELLSDSTIRNILNPVRACFGTAVREGLVRNNPTHGVALPHRPRIDDDREEVRPFTREQLATFLAVVHPAHRLMFRLIAATGLRSGEVLALQWKNLRLDGSLPVVQVRRTASQRGGFNPPKSRYGRRDVPLDAGLVSLLRARRNESPCGAAEDLIFASVRGTVLQYSNLLRRVIKPAAEEAGAPWAAMHTFRHTFASIHIARGTNAVQLSRLLGHHSPSFTLDTYVHLIDGDVGRPLVLDDELALDIAPDSSRFPEVSSPPAAPSSEPRARPVEYVGSLRVGL